MRSLVSLALVAALVVLASAPDADARTKRHRAAPKPVATTALQSLGDRQLCDGGVLISAPDQIRGCTRLISGRSARSLKAIAHYNRANARMRMADVAVAIEDYSAAIRLSPAMREALYNRAIAHQAVGNLEASMADLDATLRLAPSDVDALASRGRINLQRGRMEAAASDFEKAVSIAPAIAAARLGRAHLRARMHDWTGARADYDSVLQANPRNSEALYGRGLVVTWSGDSRRGTDDMRMALALDAGAADRLASVGLVMPPRQATAMARQD